MKILISTVLGIGVGGAQSHIDSLKYALLAEGIHTDLFCPDRVTNYWKVMAFIRALGSIDRSRIELTKIRTNNVSRKVKKAISQTDYDLIHTHDVLVADCFKQYSIPVILTVHGPVTKETVMIGKGTPAYLDYLKKTEEQAYQFARAIIAVDIGQKEIITTDYNVPSEKVKIIPNSVDTDLYAPKPLIKKSDKPFFLVPRRLVPKNGVQIAIEAFSLIRNMEAELWIAGNGPERFSLEKLASELKLTSKVRFLGSVDKSKMVNLMNASHGVIVPSIPVAGVIEATSIAALEGMSMSKPVFASNIGGLADIIKNNETGLLFEAGDSRALAKLLRDALDNIESSREIGRNARAYVIANHSLEVWVKQILEVYRDVLSK